MFESHYQLHNKKPRNPCKIKGFGAFLVARGAQPGQGLRGILGHNGALKRGKKRGKIFDLGIDQGAGGLGGLLIMVGVDICGDRNIGMSHQHLRHIERDALFLQIRAVGMPEAIQIQIV